MSKRKGFTLVELLTVIMIITLLMALALPAIVHVRRAAFTTQCSSQMRQLAQAVTIYASDHQDALPPVGIRGPLPPAVVAPSGPLLENYATILVYNPGHSYMDAPTNSKRSSVFACPSTGTEEEWSQTSTFFNPNPPSPRIIRSTYGINGTDGEGGVANLHKKYPNWVTPITGTAPTVLRDPKTLSTVPMPSRMVMFYEGLGYPGATAAVAGVDFKVNYPHGGQNQSNLVFYDSHVETLQKEDFPNNGVNAETAITDYSTPTGQTPPQHPLEKVNMRWRVDVEPK